MKLNGCFNVFNFVVYNVRIRFFSDYGMCMMLYYVIVIYAKCTCTYCNLFHVNNCINVNLASSLIRL